MRNFLLYMTCLCGMLFTMAQNDSEPKLISIDSVQVNNTYDANRPSRAAFYSAVLPGLGQAYNKRYWKLPIVYGALGTGVAIYIYNDNQYKDIREAYRIRLAGGTNDAYSNDDGTPIITDAGLERAQKTAQRNKELTLLVTAGIYILQIIDANVDAHLDDFNVDRNLSLSPTIIQFDDLPSGSNFGLALRYDF